MQDGSKSGQLTVPTLTDGNVKVKFKTGLENLTDAFNYCPNLISIPAGLFDKCPNATNFSNCFNGCAITSIPAGLFDNCPKAANLGGCFNYCSKLTSIPAGLFDKCSKVTNFTGCFSGCTKLTSIPDGLFDNCPDVTEFSSCFNGCATLTNIPEKLFAKNKKVTSFYMCFMNCSSITSKCPIDDDGMPLYKRSGEGKEGYTIIEDARAGSCFENCNKMADYTSIPYIWKFHD